MNRPANSDGAYLAGSDFSVQLQLLHACNLRCKHCYDSNTPRVAAPPTSELLRWIDCIDDLSAELKVTPALHLSGGEPTLRPDLPEIVDYAANQRGRAVLLLTNGINWTAEYAARLEQAGLRYVQVSLEGPEAVNDEVRGVGAYRAALTAIKMLTARGLRVTVSVTVTAQNYPYLEEFVATLDPLGIHFHVREVLPIGAGANCRSLSFDQRRMLYSWGIRYRGSSSIGLEDPVHCSILPRYARSRHGCVAGRNHFCIDVDGTIYPCRPLRLAVGHVNNLRAAWYSPSMTRLRERRLGGRCRCCELREHCGGCRVHALQSGNAFGEDPRCFASEHDLAWASAEEQAIAWGTRIGGAIGRLALRARVRAR